MALEETWRWYGPSDPVTLQHIRQAGATGIVTALHQIPGGQVWPIEEVQERKRVIKEAGLTWSVVESISVHEEIKYGGPNRDQLIENYKQSIRNCAALGIDTFCYNFMPVLDWSRTSLDFTFDDESLALQFDIVQFAAFELFILKRPGAVDEYNDEVKAAARRFLDTSTADDREKLTTNLLKGLPGTTSESYSLENFQEALDVYNGIKPEQLRENLRHFLSKVVPVAEELNVMLAIHPDDPPRSLLGLPRVVSTNEDVRFILSCADSTANGLCFCVGSYGSREGNDVPEMAREHARRINFVHLRNVRKSGSGSFVESNHLDGDVDMYEVVLCLLRERQRRIAAGRPEAECRLPWRPDHGHKMLTDLDDPRTNPGYPAVGRLRGLAELRGLFMGVARSGVV